MSLVIIARVWLQRILRRKWKVAAVKKGVRASENKGTAINMDPFYNANQQQQQQPQYPPPPQHGGGHSFPNPNNASHNYFMHQHFQQQQNLLQGSLDQQQQQQDQNFSSSTDGGNFSQSNSNSGQHPTSNNQAPYRSLYQPSTIGHNNPDNNQ